jgi:hypothetical protein
LGGGREMVETESMDWKFIEPGYQTGNNTICFFAKATLQ